VNKLVELPWANIHNFLLASGSIRDPKNLCIEIVKRIHALVSYDQARIYFINYNGKICDEFLVGVDKKWSKVYREYFSTIANGRYDVTKIKIENSAARNPLNVKNNVHDWGAESGEFISDYINPQGIRYSVGFGFMDSDYMFKCACALDRTGNNPFSEYEIGIIGSVVPHLNNLHMNLYTTPKPEIVYPMQTDEGAVLTRREAEIAGLLRGGVTPANIGRKLSLSVSTVYRHIANLHAKLRVSNRQELIVKLLNQ
jgi:DNA-binding CsgD family transcriptional regulator